MTQISELVCLPFVKSKRRPELMGYELLPCMSPQARFRGRVLARPALDLKQYRCRAVIDWLEIGVSLGRPTQFQHVQDAITGAGLRRPHVIPINRNESLSTAQFKLKIQDASPEHVLASLAALREVFGLITEPTVEAIEISVDFVPKVPSDTSRALMTGVLGRHLFPTRDIYSHGRDRPRFGLARGHRPIFLVGASSSARTLEPLRHTGKDQRLPVDATLYVGRQFGPVQWKVMEKVLDNQRPDGTRRVLGEAEKRARVEITLDRGELEALGIRCVDDLTRFSFARLQGRYFRFMLPTFARPTGTLAAVAAHFERQRFQRFQNAGVGGLLLMDEATSQFHARHRKSVLKDLRSRALKSLRSRVGRGIDQRYEAYAELNDRVSNALEKLGMRWRSLSSS